MESEQKITVELTESGRWVARKGNQIVGATNPVIAVALLEYGYTAERLEGVLPMAAHYDVAAHHVAEDVKTMNEIRDGLMDVAEKNGMSEEGGYRLIEKKTTREIREIPASVFYEKHPEEFWQVATIPVGAADRVVGKAEATKMSTITVKETSKLVIEEVL